jgi:hypothetical protein
MMPPLSLNYGSILVERRFTCWNQFTNRRYENDGARIDYCLVDASLLQHVQKGDKLRCGCSCNHDDDPEAAALCAVTANGAFKAVSFQGEGIQTPPRATLDTQFGPPHTGIIYTPPSFSDHVGVSLLVNDALRCCDLTLDEQDSSTRKAQPHKMQMSIASFFSAGKTKTSTNSTSRFANYAKAASQPKKGIKSFFVPRDEPQTNGSSKRPKLAPNSRDQKVAKGKKTPSILHHFHKYT